MTRLLVARGALDMIVTMQAHGVLAVVLPAAPRLSVLARLIEIERRQGLEPDAMLRLGALAVAVAEDAQRIGRALKVSREERGVLDLAARVEARLPESPDPRTARVLLYRAGLYDFRRMIALAWAQTLDAPVACPSWTETLSLPTRWVAPKLPVTGADVMGRGIPAGPAVGEALRRIEAWWIEQDFKPERAELLDRL
jgi:poly(A) polymerase